MPGITAVRAMDLSHHLSLEARQRKPNAMKALWRLTKRRPNMISLGTGAAHTLLFYLSLYSPLMSSTQVIPTIPCIPSNPYTTKSPPPRQTSKIPSVPGEKPLPQELQAQPHPRNGSHPRGTNHAAFRSKPLWRIALVQVSQKPSKPLRNSRTTTTLLETMSARSRSGTWTV